MVVLNVKRGEEAQFLYETSTQEALADLIPKVAAIYNGRLRVDRLATELELLADHGIQKPPEMRGLTDEQVAELKLVDEWAQRCYPQGGQRFNPDLVGCRSGAAPSEKLSEVLKKTAAEARALVAKTLVTSNKPLTLDIINEAISKCRGATMIAYPMGLPPHEEVQMILDDKEDLSGKQAKNLVIEEDDAQLWWAGKELMRGKKLFEFVGKNEKTKLVVKIQKKGSGAPSREPVVDEETQKQMMAYAYKKQEEWKKLEEADDDAYLNAAWANPGSLKQQLNGTSSLSWRPR